MSFVDETEQDRCCLSILSRLHWNKSKTPKPESLKSRTGLNLVFKNATWWHMSSFGVGGRDTHAIKWNQDDQISIESGSGFNHFCIVVSAVTFTKPVNDCAVTYIILKRWPAKNNLWPTAMISICRWYICQPAAFSAASWTESSIVIEENCGWSPGRGFSPVLSEGSPQWIFPLSIFHFYIKYALL